MSRKKIWSAPLALIVVVTMALFFGGITVSADEVDSGTCGENVTWSLDDNGTLTISGTGEMEAYDWNTRPWYSYSSSIESVVIENGITSIPKYAFAYLGNLKSASIPSSVTTIGDSAFESCGLTSVSIPNGVTAIGDHMFANCYSLETVSIPGSVKTIGPYAFGCCEELTTVTIGSNSALKTIDGHAFNYCYKLSSINLPDSVTSIGESAFQECKVLTSINLGNSMKTIGDSAFESCYKLTVDSFPGSLESIGSCAFDSTAISTLSLPSSIKSIGSAAFSSCNNLTTLSFDFDNDVLSKGAIFSYCSGLTSVSIKGNVTTIGASMFSGCADLATLSIPDSVTSIGASAFSGCEKLNYTFPAGITSYGDYALKETAITSATISSDKSYGKGVYAGCKSLTSVTIDNGITSIPDELFNGCANLGSIEIPSSVTSIGAKAFEACGLTSITLPQNLESIGERAFYGCKFTELKLNTGLKSIGSEAFSYIWTLKTVVLSDSVTNYGNRVFACTGVTSVSMTIDDSVTFGYGLFSGCNGLESVVISGNRTSLGSGFFEECGKLTSVKLPDSLTSIDSSMFRSCSKLAAVNIPDNVTSIGYYAFYGCTALKSINIPGKVESIDFSAFANSGLVSVVIPENVKSMGTGVFDGCSNLTSASLNGDMTLVPSYTFNGCSRLTTVNFSSKIKTIESDAFRNSGFVIITIPGTVETIESEAFADCEMLQTVEIQEGVTGIDGSAFYSCNSLETVVLPSTLTTGLAYESFIYCNKLKTIYCNAYQKSVLTTYHPNANYIIIDNANNISPQIAGHSITLAADIGVNFYVMLPVEYNSSNTQVTFTWGSAEDNYAHTVNAKLTPVYENGANYMASCGVAARAMSDTITMTVKSGDTVLMTDEYSVMQYVKILAKTYPYNYDLQRLLAAMVTYGGHTQFYFNYHKGQIFEIWNDASDYGYDVDAYRDTLDDLEPAYDDMTIRTISNADFGLSYYGTSLLCTSQMKLRFYFRVTDAAAFAKIKDTAYFKSKNLKFVEKEVGGENLVYIETQGLMPGDLQKIFEITIGGKTYRYDYKDYMMKVKSSDVP